MKTVLQIEVTHSKPLPKSMEVTDVASQRLYMWLYSQGVEAGGKAQLIEEWELKPLPVLEMKGEK